MQAPWRVTEAPWRLLRRSAAGSEVWCLHSVLDLGVDVAPSFVEVLRYGRCCLEKVDLLMAGGAAEVLPVSLSCPLPLLRTRPPSLLVCCFFVFVEMGATSTASGRLEVSLFLSEKRGGKSHFGIFLVSAA